MAGLLKSAVTCVDGVGLRNVEVDGMDISRCVRGLSLTATAGRQPSVRLEFAAPDNVFRLEGAEIRVDSIAVPATVEIALWRHLSSKYGKEVEVTTMSSTSRGYIVAGD
ncbi:hypothetical protein [Burkholderia multivorans]|uniref:hypothetical protein n=1 Tax=Burkholderia multivorans TaxID=87883 RepID=UPI0005B95132|nr:hypothetical protein [Burkholderia multivorans]